MLPGRVMRCSAFPRVILARATVGTAWAFVHCTSSCLLRVRLTKPSAAIALATTMAMVPVSRSQRRLGVLTGWEDMGRADLVKKGLVGYPRARQPHPCGHEHGQR